MEITDVRGLGLLVGFDLTSPDRADHVIAYARDHGVLLIKAAAADDSPGAGLDHQRR